MTETNVIEMKNILTIPELAERLKVKEAYVRTHAPIMVGFFKVGGQVRFDWTEIEYAIKQKKDIVQKMVRPA